MYNEEQFNEIYQACKHDVLKVAFGILGDRDLALDISQDVFLKLYCHLDSGEQIRYPSVWIRTVTRNACIDYLRKNCKFKIVPLAEKIYLNNAYDKVDIKFQIEEIFSDLNKKNKLWYDLVYLRFEGNTYKEICLAYEMSESEVRRTLDKAYRYLQARYKDYYNFLLLPLIVSITFYTYNII